MSIQLHTVHAVSQRLIYPSAFIAGNLGMEEPSGLMKTLTYAYQGTDRGLVRLTINAQGSRSMIHMLPFFLFHNAEGSPS